MTDGRCLYSTESLGAICFTAIVLSFGVAACGADAGAEGDAAATAPKSCEPGCDTAEDCGPDPDRWTCSGGICQEDICSSDPECVPELSSFRNEGCATGECVRGTCIEYRETTYCAVEAASSDACPLGAVEAYETADGSGTASICVVENPSCNDGACESGEPGQAGCTTDDQCRGDAVCEDGDCKCSADSDCPGGLICDSAGDCRCETDDDCPAGLGWDQCRSDGICVCTDDSSCAQLGENYVCRE